MPAGRTILIVEDDRDIRESLTEAFEDEGYAVVAAIDGVDALERLHGAMPPPSLILLDLMMPRMNGAEFCAEKQKNTAWDAIPIVVLSADSHAKEKIAGCGAAGHLKKPVTLDLLFATVARVLAESTP